MGFLRRNPSCSCRPRSVVPPCCGSANEKTVCEPREDGGMEESESGLDMDVDMMLDGLEMFEMGV